MATFCDGIVQNIERTECIGNSLVKINNNFAGLESAGCDLETLVNTLEETLLFLRGNVTSLSSNVTSLSSNLTSLSNTVQLINSVPVGTVSAFVGSAAPSGWIKANGAVVSNTGIYQALSNLLYVGNGLNATASFGYKCTSNTTPATTRSTSGSFIVLPDLRGYFVRGLGTNANGTASVSYGSIQADEFKSHSHTYSKISLITNGERDNNQQAGDEYATTNTSAVGGDETRPKNIPLLYCIKY